MPRLDFNRCDGADVRSLGSEKVFLTVGMALLTPFKNSSNTDAEPLVSQHKLFNPVLIATGAKSGDRVGLVTVALEHPSLEFLDLPPRQQKADLKRIQEF